MLRLQAVRYTTLNFVNRAEPQKMNTINHLALEKYNATLKEDAELKRQNSSISSGGASTTHRQLLMLFDQLVFFFFFKPCDSEHSQSIQQQNLRIPGLVEMATAGKHFFSINCDITNWKQKMKKKKSNQDEFLHVNPKFVLLVV